MKPERYNFASHMHPLYSAIVPVAVCDPSLAAPERKKRCRVWRNIYEVRNGKNRRLARQRKLNIAFPEMVETVGRRS